MKYCVVTMIFSKYEKLHEPVEVDPDADYYCITDDKELTSEKWTILYDSEFDTDELNGIQKTYRCKYHIYRYIPNVEQYDYIVRADGSISIYKSLKPIVNYMNRGKYDISVAPHPWRNNFLDEYTIWQNTRNLDARCIALFLSNVKDYDYKLPALCENSFHIYHNCKEVLNFLDDVYTIMNLASPEKELIDANDQCYFTYMLYSYRKKLRVNYHPSTLYRFSEYMATNIHNTDTLFYNEPLPYDSKMMFFDNIIFVNDIKDYTKFENQ